MRPLWMLPNSLNREFSLLEKIHSWFRPYAITKGDITIHPYELRKRFKGRQFLTENPCYYDFGDGERVELRHETERYFGKTMITPPQGLHNEPAELRSPPRKIPKGLGR